MRRDPKTGDVILSAKPDSWDGLFQHYGKADVPGELPADFRPTTVWASTAAFGRASYWP